MTGYLQEPPEDARRSDMVEGVFSSLASLLRACHDREKVFAGRMFEAEGTPKEHCSKNYLSEHVSRIECPGLCLRHEGHLNMDKSTRIQAQLEAASLLTRPLRVEVDPIEKGAGSIRIEDLPKILMNNIYESFAILVDSRLRVYAKVFFRHLTCLMSKQADAFGVLQMGQKLDTLHDIGGHITAQSMQMHFELEDENPEEVDPGVFQQAFRIEASMELHVPSPTGQNRTFAVRHQASGLFQARDMNESNKLRLTVEVEAKALLRNMMDQASLIVAEIVQATNEAFSLAEPKMERGESFLVMPPPKPRREKTRTEGLELLAEATAAKEMAVITPDLAAKNSNLEAVAPLQLHEEEDCDASVDDLSVDQCVSLVDDLFGDFDDALSHGPPLKKAKLSK